MSFSYQIGLQGEHVCGIASNATQGIVARAYSLSTPCPKGCVEYKSQNLSNPIFVLNSDGTLSLNETNENVKFSLCLFCISFILCFDDNIPLLEF